MPDYLSDEAKTEWLDFCKNMSGPISQAMKKLLAELADVRERLNKRDASNVGLAHRNKDLADENRQLRERLKFYAAANDIACVEGCWLSGEAETTQALLDRLKEKH